MKRVADWSTMNRRRLLLSLLMAFIIILFIGISLLPFDNHTQVNASSGQRIADTTSPKPTPGPGDGNVSWCPGCSS
ncbi:MAG: hypothetical protein U0350_07290 [Caldilineaceae bacterium]